MAFDAEKIVKDVARAICAADGGEPDEPVKVCGKGVRFEWQSHEHTARAAILAYKIAKVAGQTITPKSEIAAAFAAGQRDMRERAAESVQFMNGVDGLGALVRALPVEGE